MLDSADIEEKPTDEKKLIPGVLLYVIEYQLFNIILLSVCCPQF